MSAQTQFHKVASDGALVRRRSLLPKEEWSLCQKCDLPAPAVWSSSPVRKHPIRPTAIPTHNGTANKSPVRRVIPRCRLATSTANNPPISAPTMVFPPIKYRGSRQCANIMAGSSNQYKTLLPTTAPIAAAAIIHQRSPSPSRSPRRFRSSRYTRNATAYASVSKIKWGGIFSEPRDM